VTCELLGVSRSGYYDWQRRPPSERALSDAWLTERIKAIHAANRGVYGARRVHAELRLAEGIRVGRKRVERLMRHAAISGLVPKKRGRTTIRVPGVRVADDLVARQFAPAAPNVLWVAEITYLRTWWSGPRPSDTSGLSSLAVLLVVVDRGHGLELGG
jgi:putative transposase